MGRPSMHQKRKQESCINSVQEMENNTQERVVLVKKSWVLLSEIIRELSPAYFALVMATGIVSIALHLQDFKMIAFWLYWINLAAYPTLGLMYILRIIFYTNRFREDFISHTTGPGFFTVVAASGVLGSQAVILAKNFLLAAILWAITFSLWICLNYSIFTVLCIKETKPDISKGINGAWLISIVATQAVTVLSTIMAPYYITYREPILLLALTTWLFGGMLYIWIISLIFYRYTFFHFSPEDLTPPYWINMGAVAITTLGGAGLIANAHNSFLATLLPFLKGFTFFFWATSSWWIPMLLILGIWRHIYKKFPLRYSPLYWGAVFPLGMYTTCTFKLSEVMHIPILMVIPRYFIYIALIAWIATFLGLMEKLISFMVSLLRLSRS